MSKWFLVGLIWISFLLMLGCCLLLVVGCTPQEPKPADTDGAVEATVADAGELDVCGEQGAVCTTTAECCPGLGCRYVGGFYARCEPQERDRGVPPGYWQRGCGLDACGGPLPIDRGEWESFSP